MVANNKTTRSWVVFYLLIVVVFLRIAAVANPLLAVTVLETDMSLRCNVAFVIISGLFLTTEVCGQRRASTRNSLKILQQAHRRLHTQYADEMGKIARDCEEQGFVDESA